MAFPLTVKISIGGAGPDAQLGQFISTASETLQDVALVVNDPSLTEADAWIVVEGVDAHDSMCVVSPDCVAFVGAETIYTSAYWERYRKRRSYLAQFSEVHTWLPLRLRNRVRSLPYLPWMINANHGPAIFSPHWRDVDELAQLNPTKHYDLSVICSDKAFTPGQIRRLELVRNLAERLGERLHWYGNGVNQIAEKWDGIAPYRYTLVIENDVAPDLITEKLYDAYLGLAMPLYVGAPNVHDFFPPDSILQIDIQDLPAAIEEIDRLSAQPLSDSQRASLLAARSRVLKEFNMAERLGRLGLSLGARRVCSPRRVHLEGPPVDSWWMRHHSRLRHRAKTMLRM